MERLNPDGNERLTAAVGIVLIALTLVELATLFPLGLHQFLSLHVFIGFVLIPPVLLKLASTGWRFTRYYTRNSAYLAKGAPQLMMRLLAPVLVAATVVLFASGVAMGRTHGRSLRIARQLHGPASVVWMILVGARPRLLEAGTPQCEGGRGGLLTGCSARLETSRCLTGMTPRPS